MSEQRKKTNDNKTVADLLYSQVIKNITAFYQEYNSFYCTIKDCGKKLYAISGQELENYIRMLYLGSYEKVISSEAIKQVVSTLTAVAFNNAEPFQAHLRLAQRNDIYYYNLNNGNVVLIHQKKVITKSRDTVKVFFRDSSRQLPQVAPDLTVKATMLPELLERFFPIQEDDLLLFTCYLVSCFIDSLDHPLFILQGPPGTGKSSFLSNISKLIDPIDGGGLYQLPTKSKDMAAILNGAHFVAFDNIEQLSRSQSDFFCQVVTGTAVAQKALYTNFDIAQVELHNCVALNGISNIATQQDLLSRAILLELMPLEIDAIKPKSKLDKAFDKTLPKILGACLRTLQGALKVDEPSSLNIKTRMVDFAIWGYRIAESLQPGWGQQFLDDYEHNQTKAQSAKSTLPIEFTTMKQLVDGQGGQWQGTMTELWEALSELSDRDSFPKSAASLSRIIHQKINELDKIGIRFQQKNGGNRMVTLTMIT